MSDYYFSSSVKRLHQQWGAATARSVDASHRTTYLPFNPQGLPIEIQIHTHRPTFNPHGDRQPKGQNTEPNPPQNVMQNQYNFCSYLSQCHELWEQADLYVSRGQCEGLFYLSFSVSSFFEFFVPRFLYSIGPRVWAVDPALQLEGPGLLHKEGPEDSECFDQWRGSKCGPSSFFPSSWTEWTGPQVGPQVMRRTNRITDYERGIMDMMSPL